MLRVSPLPVNKQGGSFILLVLVMTGFLAGLSLLGFKNTIQSSKLTAGFINNKLVFSRAQAAMNTAQTHLENTKTQHTEVKSSALSSYMIEKLLLAGADTNTQYYRVTTKGFDQEGLNVVTIQAIIRESDQLVRVSWQQLP